MRIPMAVRIRQARCAAGMTQERLASSVHVNRSAVAQWEREGGTHPSFANLLGIALATRVSFEWLATGRGCKDTDECIEAPSNQIHTNDEIEARCIRAVRLLPRGKRVSISLLLQQLAS